jgi:diguanylate cyclase (GGDEF)-like protein
LTIHKGMSIGVIKEGLFRTASDDVPQMSRVLGVLYLSGGLLILLSLLLPHPGDAYEPGLFGIVGVGVFGGTAGIVWARHARAWMIHVVLAAGTLFICLADYFAGVGAGVYSAMFVWVVLMAASFFSRQAVVAQVAWIVIAWAITLASLDSSAGFPSTTRWVLGSLVLIVAAGVMSEIVAGRRSTEEDRERLQRELIHMAHHDPLTGVANRRLFEQELPRELARAKRLGASVCILGLDLDRFKSYNDGHGHVAGDQLLKATASTWSSELRAADLLARMGGDEFVALLPDCAMPEAELVAERLRSGMPMGATCSIGMACWDGRETPESLLRRADKAMYDAKVRNLAARGARAEH